MVVSFNCSIFIKNHEFVSLVVYLIHGECFRSLATTTVGVKMFIVSKIENIILNISIHKEKCHERKSTIVIYE